MNVRVLMFGALRDVAASDVTFEIGEAATGADVFRAVSERYPAATPILARCALAVDHEIVDRSRPISAHDEIALLPPMSGGSIRVALSETPSVDAALAAAADDASGGHAIFVGTVRNTCERGPVDALEYSAYDEMAARTMRDIAQEACDKWGLSGVAIEHAVGMRAVGEITFVVVCAAAHRDEAFDGCRYVVDEVKRRAPVWKKEIGPWGERWVGL